MDADRRARTARPAIVVRSSVRVPSVVGRSLGLSVVGDRGGGSSRSQSAPCSALHSRRTPRRPRREPAARLRSGLPPRNTALIACRCSCSPRAGGRVGGVGSHISHARSLERALGWPPCSRSVRSPARRRSRATDRVLGSGSRLRSERRRERRLHAPGGANGVGPNLSLDLLDVADPAAHSPRPLHEDQAGEVERLKDLGATDVHWDKRPPDADYVILADPEGNRFASWTSARDTEHGTAETHYARSGDVNIATRSSATDRSTSSTSPAGSPTSSSCGATSRLQASCAGSPRSRA